MTISLALKYRPKTFDDLVEQGPIRQILEHQLKTKTFPNSALFTGPAGTGKTTTSRIVAREINEGKGNPIEIDGASNNGVDNIRNVIDGSKFKSLSGEYKCYIIDECFHKDTLIRTIQGNIRISDITPGTQVYTMFGTGVVKNVLTKYVDTLYRVSLNNGTQLTCSGNHMFMTQVGWVMAKDLNYQHKVYTTGVEYDCMELQPVMVYDDTTCSYIQDRNLEQYFIDNNKTSTLSIESVTTLQEGDVLYDLTIENGHCSFFANDILVHNCHMLSIGAWNAMLKLLEEPPAQTIFLLCTTDPQKIPATILSRVQRYDFQKISFKGVVDRLKYILDSEMASENELGITSYQMEALEYIAKVANGGMRDAITLLDKCLSYATDLTVESTIKALGTVNYDLLFNLLESLYNKQEKSVIDILEQTYKEGIDLKLFLKNFLQFILELCKYDTCRDFSYVYIPNTYASKLDGYPKDIYMYCRKLLNSLVQWNSEIKWETNPKTLLESRFMLELINDNRSN